jgi:hypothetical protein
MTYVDAPPESPTFKVWPTVSVGFVTPKTTPPLVAVEALTIA